MSTDWRERIAADPGVCHGKACIAGTRVMVSIVLDCLAEGMSRVEILDQYPSLQDDDITAAMRYATWIARREIVPLTPPQESNAA